MRYRKQIQIKRKRIKKEDVLQLAHIVESEISENGCKQSFEIDFWDNSNISDVSSDVFNSTSFERKRAKRISIEYYSKSFNDHIEIELYDSTYLDHSEIKISSNDQLWYEAMITKFTDILQGVEPQSKLSILFQSPVIFGLCVFLGMLLNACCITLISNIVNKNGSTFPLLIQFSIVIIICAINLMSCILAAKYLEKAFPLIEFCFGPEHMNSGLKTRKALIWCGATFAPSIILRILDIIITG